MSGPAHDANVPIPVSGTDVGLDGWSRGDWVHVRGVRVMSASPGSLVDRSGVSQVARVELGRALANTVRGEVYFESGIRAIYATDSSNYRQVPLGIVCPLDEEDLLNTLAVCRRFKAPVVGRGAGTSLAGQACNVAVVVDTSRHMDQILEIDVASLTARVQPGVVLDDLRAALAPYGLTFGPDPATHAWCTLGGMVGNNSCGTHALHAGKTVDNVVRLRVLTYDGVVMDLGPMDDDEYLDVVARGGRRGEIYQELRELVADLAINVRSGYPDLARRVSGYNLDQLLPENGFNAARAVVGSESTCVLFSEVTVSLIEALVHRRLVVLGFEDIYAAADHVTELLSHPLIGLEGFDDVLVRHMRSAHLNISNLELLPPGNGWLLAEVGADDPREADQLARRVLESRPSGATAVLFSDSEDQKMVWQIRESGLGATADPVGEPMNHEGWEDAAVPPENLGTYLRGIRDLWAEFGYSGAWYGHFGQGCVHTRNNFDFGSLEGLANYRRYVERAARFCVSLGGSLSGEHGDGQSRGELLEIMYGPEIMHGFRRFKAIWDPDDRMNPGKLIDAFPLDTNLRHGPSYQRSTMTPVHFSFATDHGSMQLAAERCVGVGRCRREDIATMCPSFRATHDEKHSTRGRAKLIEEMFRGDITESTWRNEDVFAALDLCLSCKACANECPTHVDMATYKAEFLSNYYARRLRPLSAYVLGYVARSGRVASKFPRLSNAVVRSAGIGSWFKRFAGITTKRRIPEFAPRTLRRSLNDTKACTKGNPTVMLWPDTFTDQYRPEVGMATIAVLEAAGERVAIPEQWGCCGRPFYDSGMLKQAKASLRQILDILQPAIDGSLPIIVPEPSCLATFRDELPALLDDDPRALVVSTLVRSLCDHLDELNWTPPLPGRGEHVALHPHCHQQAIHGTQNEQRVLERAGFTVEVLDAGCCGLAGSFGFKSEHEALSRQIGNDRFAPLLHEKSLTALLVMDGFSCQTQAEHLGAPAATTVAELLAKQI
jgi:FAD/FMN-containing dehydrogenase/Fe-S oxidoreductase